MCPQIVAVMALSLLLCPPNINCFSKILPRSGLMSFKLELVVVFFKETFEMCCCMSCAYLMIFVEAGTKYFYVFMFLCSIVLPPFSFFRVLQVRDWWTSA